MTDRELRIAKTSWLPREVVTHRNAMLGMSGKAGLEVLIIGGDHGDLPLDPTMGKRLGELVAEGKVAGIFDLSGFETDASRVAGDTVFASKLLF